MNTVDAAENDVKAAQSQGASPAGDLPGRADERPDATPCEDVPLTMRIEALLLASDRPLTTGRLGELLGIETRGLGKRIKETIEQLNTEYEQTGRSFRIEQVAGGWRMYTVEAVGPLVAREQTHRQSNRLSQAAMETLSIVAYRQPILRAEIEAIRGVASGEVLRGLMERRLVTIVGRAEELGRPMLYGTTRFFLEVFGLASLEDLPPVEGLTPGDAKTRTDPSATGAENADRASGEPGSDGEQSATSVQAPSDEQVADTDDEGHRPDDA